MSDNLEGFVYFVVSAKSDTAVHYPLLRHTKTNHYSIASQVQQNINCSTSRPNWWLKLKKVFSKIRLMLNILGNKYKNALPIREHDLNFRHILDKRFPLYQMSQHSNNLNFAFAANTIYEKQLQLHNLVLSTRI